MVQSRSRDYIRVQAKWQVTYRFPRAQQNICDELGASRRESPADRLVLGGTGAGSIRVDVLEDLVEAELSEALEGVADEGRPKSDTEALEALGCVDLLEAIADTGVKTRVSLNKAVRI